MFDRFTALFRADRTPPPSWDDWIVATRDPDGHVRQRAVEALAASRHGPAISALLARTNDWVAQVREAAVLAVEAFLVDEQAAHWAAALDPLAALNVAGRSDHAPMLARITRYLLRPPVLAAVKADAAVLSPRARRHLLGLELAVAEGAAGDALLEETLAAPDIVMALMALADVARIPDVPRRTRLARLACASAFAPVRVAALRVLLRPGAADGGTASFVESLCLDPNALVRSLALRSLAGGRDALFDRAARQLAAGPGGTRRAVGLDVMCTLDLVRAQPALAAGAQDPAAPVRRTATAWMFRAADGPTRDRLVESVLLDEAASVRALAVRQVKQGAAPPRMKWMREALRRIPGEPSSFLRVAVHLPPWGRLEVLLRVLLADPLSGPGYRGPQGELAQWCRDMQRCFVAPSAQEAEMLGRMWKALGERVEPVARRGVAAQLRANGVAVGGP